MKTIRLILIAVVVTGLTACGNKTLRPEDMTGWKTKVLLGPVEKVTYSNGDYVAFDRNGNVVEESDPWRSGDPRTYQYESPYRYTMYHVNHYGIEYNDSMRMEVYTGDTTERLSIDYLFDDRGRIKSKSGWDIVDGGEVDIQYIYNNNSFLPYQMIKTEYSGDGEEFITTETYNYTEIDKHGNWLKCDVTEQIESDYWDEDTRSYKKVPDNISARKLIRSINYFMQEAPSETSNH